LTNRAWLLFWSACLASCATSETALTQENIDRANKVCETSVKTDKLLGNPMWFSRWIACKKEKIMPFEIAIHPDKEQGIKAMYDELGVLAVGVDYGLKPVQSVYREWDRMQNELNINKCLVRVEQRDGSSRCELR
jgi:hypothetical protein